MFGENPSLDNLPSVDWYLYVVGTIIINTVALNLLISIIGETFSNVMTKMNGHHVLIKAEILCQYSNLMVATMGSETINNEDRVYLHFFRNIDSKISSANNN